MAFQFRGDRFNVDLEPDGDGADEGDPHRSVNSVSIPFVKDITERTENKLAVAPSAKGTSTGFPVHKKRTGASLFKQQRLNSANAISSDFRQATKTNPEGFPNAEIQGDPAQHGTLDKNDIDKENREKLSKMTEAEIASEREELLNSLTPSLIQRLLRRSNIDEAQDATDFPIASHENFVSNTSDVADSHDGKGTGNPQSSEKPPMPSHQETPAFQVTAPEEENILNPSIHFPQPKSAPDLDLTSPNFLDELHEKYFPNLQHDPSKLAWMDSTAPNAAQSNAYAATNALVPISALRFSFTGELLPPSISNSISASKGLHHHGDSPEAAGYTIAELAHLARSSFPSQRCFAFQTLGRILYRLGIGEFGKLERGFSSDRILKAPENEDDEEHEADEDQNMEDIARGLWDCIRQGRVLETLEAEANKEGGHVSAKAYATEALWLWRKGGGTEVRAT